jgi:hypothetical protein
MTDGKLKEVLRKHAAWIERGMLNWSDPDRARLDHASLDGASLDHARLVGASLDHARLVGASLVGARLDHARLWNATGIICLPVGDSRGYRPVAVWQGDLWTIAAGCRWFTVDEARTHYARPESASGSRALAEMYLAAIDWLEKQPLPSKAGPAS